MKKFIYNWLPVFLYAGIIYLASSYPVKIPGESDKLIHFLEYGLMGFLTTRAILLSQDVSKFWGIALGFLLATGLGALDEFHQSFISYRQASWGDLIADALGALVGSFAYVYLGILLYRSKKLYPGSGKSCG